LRGTGDPPVFSGKKPWAGSPCHVKSDTLRGVAVGSGSDRSAAADSTLRQRRSAAFRALVRMADCQLS